MARFAIGEYIRNIGYNIVSILLLTVVLRQANNLRSPVLLQFLFAESKHSVSQQ